MLAVVQQSDRVSIVAGCGINMKKNIETVESCGHFKYGMSSRPFGLGTYPDNGTFVGAEDGTIIEGISFHNILEFSSPLSDYDMSHFSLVDINWLLKGGVKWDNITKTIAFLISRDLKSKFLSEMFFRQVQMKENEFNALVKKNGYASAEALYKEKELAVGMRASVA